jgi:hypothetical protein
VTLECVVSSVEFTYKQLAVDGTELVYAASVTFEEPEFGNSKPSKINDLTAMGFREVGRMDAKPIRSTPESLPDCSRTDRHFLVSPGGTHGSIR